MSWFNKEIKVEYRRIKRPKKDEVILFSFNELVDQKHANTFAKMVEEAFKSPKEYLVLGGPVDVIVANRSSHGK